MIQLQSTRRIPRALLRQRWLHLVLLAVLAAAGLGGATCTCRTQGKPSAAPKSAFSGNSADLKQTVIVPTLDTPMPRGKNVIWCASFQLAWNRLRDDVLKRPPRVAGAEAVTKRLAAAKASADDLLPASYVAMAGFVRDGVLPDITRTLADRFPEVAPPEFDGPLQPDHILAYAYLQANVAFTIPFFENDRDFTFSAADGTHTQAQSFGIRPEDDYAYYGLRKQVRILYQPEYSWRNPPARVDGHCVYEEFALDPCVTSQPYQVVLALTRPGDTLAGTLAALDAKMASASPDDDGDFGPNDVLLVPTISWSITHHFRELEDRDHHLLNREFEGYWIQTAMQSIQFKLDRSGAELASEAKEFCAPTPTHFVFDRPFLIYLKKRGAENPFFVMWVDNAELLCRPEADTPGQ